MQIARSIYKITFRSKKRYDTFKEQYYVHIGERKLEKKEPKTPPLSSLRSTLQRTNSGSFLDKNRSLTKPHHRNSMVYVSRHRMSVSLPSRNTIDSLSKPKKLKETEEDEKEEQVNEKLKENQLSMKDDLFGFFEASPSVSSDSNVEELPKEEEGMEMKEMKMEENEENEIKDGKAADTEEEDTISHDTASPSTSPSSHYVSTKPMAVSYSSLRDHTITKSYTVEGVGQKEIQYPPPYDGPIKILFKLPSLFSPRLKLECLLDAMESTMRCCKEFWEAHGKEVNMGADDLVPVFAWVVLKAQIPKIFTEMGIIQVYFFLFCTLLFNN